MLREGVTVKESRGRLSYLTPDRTKPITARKLGDDFDKAAVLALLTQNAHRAAEQTTAIPEYPHTQKALTGEKAAKTTPADNTLQRMVDREAKRAEGKGVGYDRWAAKHNLKQMAATVTAYQQYGFSSPEELDEACSAAYAAMQESLTELKQVEKTLNGKKELQRQVLAYSKTRPVRDGLKQQKNAKAKAAYRQKHESDFIIADAAARYFRENGISKLPSYKALQAEIESLIKEKNSGYNDYRAKREEYRRLQTVKGNIDQILRRERTQTAKLLYSLLLDRSTLSQKNKWLDDEGRIYIIYPIAEIAEILDKGSTTIKGALNELDTAGLLERERGGFSAPNRLYVKVPPVPQVQFSDQLMAGSPPLIEPENRPTDGQKTDLMMVGKPSPNQTTINNLTESQTKGVSGGPSAPYGRYGNIFLSQTEYDELQAEYPDRLERFIEEMSRYLAANGKSYQNYAAALRIWAGNDKKEAPKKGIPDYSCKEGESL